MARDLRPKPPSEPTMRVSVDDLARAMASARRRLAEERRAEFRHFTCATNSEWPASRVFHEFSSLGPEWQPNLSVDEIVALTQDLGYKRYDGHACHPLPPPEELGADLVTTLRSRRSVSEFAEEALTIGEVATLVTLGCGITDLAAIPHRAAPSGGALYPIEVYVVSLADTPPLPKGILHYLPIENALEHVAPMADTSGLGDFLPPGLVAGRPSLLIALSARFSRTQKKYGERGYRFALLEAGHIAQNLLLLATALGIGAVPVGGYWDDPFNAFLGLDGIDEAVVYSALFGRLGS